MLKEEKMFLLSRPWCTAPFRIPVCKLLVDGKKWMRIWQRAVLNRQAPPDFPLSYNNIQPLLAKAHV